MERWSIYIDIEGFSALYGQEDQILQSLGVLAEGILFIGRKCYPKTPERLFAHQTGDGFIIVREFGAEMLEQPLAIAMALLRHVAASGRFAKAAISQGEFTDVRGCYPSSVRDAARDNGHLDLGEGLMTLFPVMGMALIRAFKLAENSPSGPLLTVATTERHRIPDGVVVRETNNPDVISIDWIHSPLPLAESLARTARLNSPPVDHLESALRSYCHEQKLKPDWVSNVGTLLGILECQITR